MNGLPHQVTIHAVPASERPIRKGAVLHGAAVAVIAILTVSCYAVLDRTLHEQRESGAAIGLTARQRTMSERIASLTAQVALGDDTARHDLAATLVTLRSSERRIVSGNRAERIRPLGADADVRRLYLDGKAPLDGAISGLVRNAGVVQASSPHNPHFAAAAAAIFSATRTALPRELDAAIALRQAHSQRYLDVLRALGIITSLALLATAIGIVRPAIRRAARLAREAAEHARIATIDPLTGTLNRRSFTDRGAIEIQKAKRYNRPLSLLIIDPDHLEAINSSHGSAGGDTLLKALTAALFDGTRVTDLVGRIGGEEFAILLPETDPAGAELLAERLRRRISNLAIPMAKSTISCTVSIGVAAAEKGASFFWPTFARADEAVFEAKMRGRNRVFVNAA